MQVIELQVEITKSHEIHLKLPDTVKANKAKVIVIYDPTDTEPSSAKRVFGQFRHQIHIEDNFDDELSSEFWLGQTT